MPSARVGPDARKNLDIVAIDEPQPTFSVEAQELLNVSRIDAAMIAAGLPGGVRVVPVLLFLNPDRGLREEIDPTHVVPVRMADDDVRHFGGVDSRQAHSLIRPHVVCDLPELEPALPMKAAVEQDVVAAAPDQPDDEGDVELFTGRSADDQVGDGHIRGIGVADRLDRILRYPSAARVLWRLSTGRYRREDRGAKRRQDQRTEARSRSQDLARRRPHDGSSEWSRSLTPADSKVAICVNRASAARSCGNASAAPVPSPSRSDRSSNGRTSNRSSSAWCACSAERCPNTQ